MSRRKGLSGLPSAKEQRRSLGTEERLPTCDEETNGDWSELPFAASKTHFKCSSRCFSNLSA